MIRSTRGLGPLFPPYLLINSPIFSLKFFFYLIVTFPLGFNIINSCPNWPHLLNLFTFVCSSLFSIMFSPSTSCFYTLLVFQGVANDHVCAQTSPKVEFGLTTCEFIRFILSKLPSPNFSIAFQYHPFSSKSLHFF